MLDRQFSVEIRTPEKLVYQGEVKSIRASGTNGPFQVLTGHIPFLTTIESGELIVEDHHGIRSMATSNGVFEVLRDGVTVLVESAEWSVEIDTLRAEEALQHAREQLKSQLPDMDYILAELALARAVARLKVAKSSR